VFYTKCAIYIQIEQFSFRAGTLPQRIGEKGADIRFLLILHKTNGRFLHRNVFHILAQSLLRLFRQKGQIDEYAALVLVQLDARDLTQNVQQFQMLRLVHVFDSGFDGFQVGHVLSFYGRACLSEFGSTKYKYNMFYAKNMWWIGLWFLMMNFVKPFVQPLVRSKYMITNKTGLTFCEKTSAVYMNNFFNNKRVMTFSPAGYYGFYVAGICTYMKEHYNTSDFVFSGASAGAWNALYMTLRTDPAFFKYVLVRNYKHRHIFDIEQEMKERILQYYDTDDFDLDRLFIGVTTVGQTKIYTDFENLEDAVDCCIASSHIPWVTGSLVHMYRNQCSFDGGFSEKPYLNTQPVALHVNPTMWGRNPNMRFNLFKKGSFDLETLFQNGYRDTLLYGTSTLDKALK